MKLIITGILMAVSLYSFGQFIETEVSVSYSGPKLVFKKYGLPSFTENTPCYDYLRDKYGYKIDRVAGCVIKSHSQVRRWERHNRKFEKKMIKRHGEQWRNKFDSDLDKCIESN